MVRASTRLWSTSADVSEEGSKSPPCSRRHAVMRPSLSSADECPAVLVWAQ